MPLNEPHPYENFLRTPLDPNIVRIYTAIKLRRVGKFLANPSFTKSSHVCNYKTILLLLRYPEIQVALVEEFMLHPPICMCPLLLLRIR